MYYDANNAYPDNTSGAVSDYPANFKAQLAPYLSKLPLDPKNDGWRYYGAHRMTWASDLNCNGRYVLWAYPENPILPGEQHCGWTSGHLFLVLGQY